MHTKTHIPKDHHWFAPFIQIASGFALTLISRVHNAFDFFTIFLAWVCVFVFVLFWTGCRHFTLLQRYLQICETIFSGKKMKGWLHQNCSRSPQHLGEIGQAKDYPFWKQTKWNRFQGKMVCELLIWRYNRLQFGCPF